MDKAQKYNCLIVDDEQLAQELLESHITKMPYLNLVAKCSDAISAIQVLQQQPIDILFCDIEMPNLSGIDFIAQLQNPPAVIFTTAYSEYALKGFELEAIDYLLKPIEFERFFKATNKAIRSKNQSFQSIVSPITITQKEEYFFIKSDQKIHRIEFNDVLFIEALQKYIRIYTSQNKIMSLFSLSKIYEQLPSNNFFRVHRSFIVNIDKIEHIEGNMIRIGEHTIPVSKGQKEPFIEHLKTQGLFF